jgi:hypothetical protein
MTVYLYQRNVTTHIPDTNLAKSTEANPGITGILTYAVGNKDQEVWWMPVTPGADDREHSFPTCLGIWGQILDRRARDLAAIYIRDI